ncbi:MAG: hypothetical protein CM15mP58_20890 [Burkholderiaceae bacterium]|nr:MAG: hypothetical protein CM15mP58_20890 [Burkholderiaceae bacterium]
MRKIVLENLEMEFIAESEIDLFLDGGEQNFTKDLRGFKE